MADWAKIKTEYITTVSSYRKLAKKHAVSLKALAMRAKDEEWTKLRRDFQDKTTTKIVQETSDILAEGQAGRLKRILQIGDEVLVCLQKAVGELSNEEKVDTYRARQIVQSLKDLKEIQTADEKADKPQAGGVVILSQVLSEQEGESM